MSLFRAPTNRELTLGLAVLRAVLGVTFLMHGGQKLFVFGLAGVSGAFAHMGMPMPGVLGPFIAFVEFLGGIALVLGFLTRVAAFGVGATMVVAILAVHIKGGFFSPTGVELPLSLLGAATMLVISGPGGLSLDAVVANRSTIARRNVLMAAKAVT